MAFTDERRSRFLSLQLSIFATLYDPHSPLRQRVRADASPIKSRLNSASEAKMPNTSLPADVVVSMDAPWPVSTLTP
jgi:hypothetical protein